MDTTKTIRNRLLRALPIDTLNDVQTHLEPVEFELRGTLIEPNCPIDELYFLESGLASVVVTSEDQERIEVGHVGREGMVGSTICLGVPTSPTHTFIQAAGHGWRLNVTDYQSLAVKYPGVTALFLRYVYTLQMQVAYSALANARYNLNECLARWLLMSQDRLETDRLPLTHEFLSLMIGVRRAGVTGALATLEGQGVIKATRGMIRILNRERLLAMAGGCYGQPEAIYDQIIQASSIAA